MAEAKLSPREQIEALQKQMAGDQAQVAKELVEFVAGADTVAYVEKLQALRARAIPGQTLDQQIGQLIAVIGQLGQIGAQLFQAYSQNPPA